MVRTTYISKKWIDAQGRQSMYILSLSVSLLFLFFMVRRISAVVFVKYVRHLFVSVKEYAVILQECNSDRQITDEL